jgi:hypothetical protein
MPLLASRDIDAALEVAVGKRLAAAGFEALPHRRWVRGRSAPYRHLFEVSALKGAAFVPRWCFSLDYVPHLSANRVRWHKTNKAARADLCFDPMDFASSPPDLISAFSTRAEFERSADRVFSEALSYADKFWGSYGSLAGIRAACEWLKSLPARRFHFYNYVNHPLTFAFTLRRLGDAQEAQAEFDRFTADSRERAETLEELRNVFESVRPGDA